MSPARIAIEDLSAAQRKALGLTGKPREKRGNRGIPGEEVPRNRGRNRGNRGTTAGELVCQTCQTPCAGPAAVERHRDATGHRRYGLPGLDADPGPGDEHEQPEHGQAGDEVAGQARRGRHRHEDQDDDQPGRQDS